ncbi:MAG: Gfo/Idh/MocA family protein [Planctomycetaceae bacterium]
MSDSPKTLSRRKFMRAGAGAMAAPSIIAASALGTEGRAAPSDRMALAVIGLGSRGFNLIDEFLKERDVQIVAVCDVDGLHYRDRPWGKGEAFGREPGKRRVNAHYGASAATGVAVANDFREVCGRADVDAVVIATPDHWHALCALQAIRNGKDVYCEKPLTHTFHEGQVLYRSAARAKTVFQTGSQQRSDPRFIAAVQIAQSGKLGRITRVEVGLPAGYAEPQGDVAIVAPPQPLDYDLWCGPSEKLPYMRARHHRWWRGHRAYGGGVLMDWIGHHHDIAQMAIGMDRSGPILVEAVDWTFPKTDVYNTPQHYEIVCEYQGGIQGTISSRNLEGLKLIGDEGWVFVRRGKLEASDPRWVDAAFKSKALKGYESRPHTRNFVDCFHSRKECAAPAEVGHRSVTPAHLGYVSQSLGRALRWDPVNELAIGDVEANRLLQAHTYRATWDGAFEELASPPSKSSR